MTKEKLNILLAEDDLNLGVLLVDYLETEGFDVKLCKDGEIALKVFQSNLFSLCLLDVMLPKMDGFSLAKAISSCSVADMPDFRDTYATTVSPRY